MDTLPNEILSSIFSGFSQRYVIIIFSVVCKKWHQLILASSYSTIHLYSDKQLERFIGMINEKAIKNIPINQYVKRIVFHFPNKSSIYKYMSHFPKLQSVDGSPYDVFATQYHESFYRLLYKPTEFYYLYNSEQSIATLNNIKTSLKSLEICIVDNDSDFIPQQGQQVETIYMKTLGSINENNMNKPIKILFLPTTSLRNILKLQIDFTSFIGSYQSSYIINEYTLENIHLSCPLLESLSVKAFYMDLSDKHKNNNYENVIIPVHRLKNICFNGRFRNQHCFSYLTTKYPHLESIDLALWCNRLSSEEIKAFRYAILNMITQFSLLKKFTFDDTCLFIKIWPYLEVVQWLHQHPGQLTHLVYPHPLTFTKTKKMMELNYIEGDAIPSLQQQFNFLNHLTSLSLTLENAVDFALTFLSENENAVIVSAILKEFSIRDYGIGWIRILYFYDWLYLFPNLLSYKIGFNGTIEGDNGFFNWFIDDPIYYNNNITSFELHQLIEKRKIKQPYNSLNNYQNEKNNATTYKLISLDITSSKLWFKNGFSEFLKQCYQLQKLSLTYTTFVESTLFPTGVDLDLSHLHLEFLNINNISCSQHKDIDRLKMITRLNIKETLTECERNFKNECCNDEDPQFSLNLTCEFVDGLAYKLH
ncbi:unnamed protein product [Cunninghamella blakesleeana]